MQAVILLGGLGTRIRKLYPDIPKALVPVGGKPFLHWQIEWLAANGIMDIHLAAGHMASSIEAWTESHPFANINVTISVEPEPLGTAGGLKFVERFVRTDPFLTLNGDTLLPQLNFHGLELEHRKAGSTVTMAITRSGRAQRFGTVEFDCSGQLTAFHEKVAEDSGWINGGVYVMGRKILELIEPNRLLSLERDIFSGLANKHQIHTFRCNPPLLDMGTPEGLKAMDGWTNSGEHL